MVFAWPFRKRKNSTHRRARLKIRVSRDFRARIWRERLQRSEEYADSIRQQLQDLIGDRSRFNDEREQILDSLASAQASQEQMHAELDAAKAESARLADDLKQVEKDHEQEKFARCASSWAKRRSPSSSPNS